MKSRRLKNKQTISSVFFQCILFAKADDFHFKLIKPLLKMYLNVRLNSSIWSNMVQHGPTWCNSETEIQFHPTLVSKHMLWDADYAEFTQRVFYSRVFDYATTILSYVLSLLLLLNAVKHICSMPGQNVHIWSIQLV